MHYKFRYPYLFDGVERPDFQSLSGNLVLYGAGFQGLLAAHLLGKMHVKILCFADRDIQKQGTLYCGIPVISPEKTKEKYPNATVMATPYGLSSVWNYIKNELKYKNIITPFSLFLEFDSEEFDKLPELPDWYHPQSLGNNIEMFLMKCVDIQTSIDLFAAAVSVTERCTLKCRQCISLMPCYEKPTDFKYDEVLNDILCLIKGKKFYRVLLEGGEPFIWKPFGKLLRALCERDEIINIFTITNGTVIPDSDLLEALKNPKITVRISDYGSFGKIKELERLFSDNNINYILQLQQWYELASFSEKAKDGQKLKDITESCCKLQRKSSAYVIDGKLFKCPTQGNLHRLGIFESNPGEYVDLRDKNDPHIQQKITDYFTKPIVPAICAHCNGRGYTGVEVPPAQQLEKGEKLTVRFE